jgi:hypothetical protein
VSFVKNKKKKYPESLKIMSAWLVLSSKVKSVKLKEKIELVVVNV